MSDGRDAMKSQDHARDLCFKRLIYLHLDLSSFPRAPRWPDTKPPRESSGSRGREQRPAQARAAHVRSSDCSGRGGKSLEMHLRIYPYGSMVGLWEVPSFETARSARGTDDSVLCRTIRESAVVIRSSRQLDQ